MDGTGKLVEYDQGSIHKIQSMSRVRLISCAVWEQNEALVRKQWINTEWNISES